MTTITYKNGILATDSAAHRVVWDDATGKTISSQYGTTLKLHPLILNDEFFMCAGAGTMNEVKHIIHHLEANEDEFKISGHARWIDPTKKSKPSREIKDYNSEVILISQKRILVYNSQNPIPQIVNRTNKWKYASGTGSDFARGAMQAGASAIKALKIAIENDSPRTNYPIWFHKVGTTEIKMWKKGMRI